MGEVAHALGVGDATIRRWRARDQKDHGTTWDELRLQQGRRGWETVVAAIEQDLIDLAENKALSPAARADALYKLDAVATNIRARHTVDIGKELEFADSLARWGMTIWTTPDSLSSEML